MSNYVARDAIVAQLRNDLSNAAIARALGCDGHRVGAIRRELGLPNFMPRKLTLEQKWEKHTKPLEGGHLEWTGERASASGTPVLRYEEACYSPAAIAFEKHHGRKSQGHVKAECGVRQCVAPAHVEDEPGRQRLREQLRRIRGIRDCTTHCRNDHDLAVHGHLSPDGATRYCVICKTERRAAERDAESAAPTAVHSPFDLKESDVPA